MHIYAKVAPFFQLAPFKQSKVQWAQAKETRNTKAFRIKDIQHMLEM